MAGETNNSNSLELLEHISDGIIALDMSWNFSYVNGGAEKMLKRSRHTLIGKNIWLEFPDTVGQRFYQIYHEAVATGKPVTVEDFSITLKIWTSVAVYPSEDGLLIYFRDITMQKEAELRAAKTELNYNIFLDRITDGFLVLDKDFKYVYVNKKIGELVRHDPASLIGRNVWEVFPDAVGSLTYKAFQTAMKEQRFINNLDYYEPLDLWQENYIYPSPEGLSIFIKDVTDRKKLEKELREKERDQQFEIMVTSLEAQERERTSIGMELHDNVNQLLVSTKLMLSLFSGDPQKMSKEILVQNIQNLDTAIAEIRRISHELVTPDLEEDQLVEQLDHLVRTMLIPRGIEATIQAEYFIQNLMDRNKRLAAYRIAQEQCTNIVKHAKADKVEIILKTKEDRFTMNIIDNGIGTNVGGAGKGIGLKNIEGRTKFFEGSVLVSSFPGQGFNLQVSMPLDVN